MSTQSDEPTREPRRRTRWVRAASDRVPTRWFAGIGTGVFLAGTAAFGGLATAAEPPIDILEPGEEHRNDQLSITIERAVLIDELQDAGVYVEEGERVLAVVMVVENRWTQPLLGYPSGSVAESISVRELDAAPDSIARFDDSTQSPTLQPGVPAEVVFTWAVDADAFADTTELRITLNDMTLYTGSFVANGQWWTDPVAAAVVTVPVDDVGAGGAGE